ncbi:MAG: hypothetical protein HC923_05830 [Myxococcales bacterium]|nr:hypothetical protein [Myxococcales bacterium]
MNEKTARLIRKFAENTQQNERALKTKWNEMSQDERYAFRQEMQAKVEGVTAVDSASSEG